MNSYNPQRRIGGSGWVQEDIDVSSRCEMTVMKVDSAQAKNRWYKKHSLTQNSMPLLKLGTGRPDVNIDQAASECDTRLSDGGLLSCQHSQRGWHSLSCKRYSYARQRLREPNPRKGPFSGQKFNAFNAAFVLQ